MKYLDENKQTAKEFNDILEEGMKTGIVLANNSNLEFMIKLAYNLDFYLTYFTTAIQLYGKKENNNI